MSPHVNVLEVITRDKIIADLRLELAEVKARLAAVEAERDESRAQVIAAEMEFADYHEMRAALARAREVLREVEWDADDMGRWCPVCRHSDGTGHKPDCALKAALEWEP